MEKSFNQTKIAYKVAQTQRGTKEISGDKDNPKIVEYHQSCTLQANDDETAWCSAFVNWCYIIAGMILNPGTMNQLLKKAKFEDRDILQFHLSAIEVNKKLVLQDQQIMNQMASTGVSVKLPTRNAMARSWINFGKKTNSPEVGDIVVFSRGNNGYSGHVGFVENIGLTFIDTLGGNQGNAVNVSAYARFKVLAYIKEA